MLNYLRCSHIPVIIAWQIAITNPFFETTLWILAIPKTKGTWWQLHSRLFFYQWVDPMASIDWVAYNHCNFFSVSISTNKSVFDFAVVSLLEWISRSKISIFYHVFWSLNCDIHQIQMRFYNLNCDLIWFPFELAAQVSIWIANEFE